MSSQNWRAVPRVKSLIWNTETKEMVLFRSAMAMLALALVLAFASTATQAVDASVRRFEEMVRELNSPMSLSQSVDPIAGALLQRIRAGEELPPLSERAIQNLVEGARRSAVPDRPTAQLLLVIYPGLDDPRFEKTREEIVRQILEASYSPEREFNTFGHPPFQQVATSILASPTARRELLLAARDSYLRTGSILSASTVRSVDPVIDEIVAKTLRGPASSAKDHIRIRRAMFVADRTGRLGGAGATELARLFSLRRADFDSSSGQSQIDEIRVRAARLIQRLGLRDPVLARALRADHEWPLAGMRMSSIAKSSAREIPPDEPPPTKIEVYRSIAGKEPIPTDWLMSEFLLGSPEAVESAAAELRGRSLTLADRKHLELALSRPAVQDALRGSALLFEAYPGFPPSHAPFDASTAIALWKQHGDVPRWRNRILDELLFERRTRASGFEDIAAWSPGADDGEWTPGKDGDKESGSLLFRDDGTERRADDPISRYPRAFSQPEIERLRRELRPQVRDALRFGKSVHEIDSARLAAAAAATFDLAGDPVIGARLEQWLHLSEQDLHHAPRAARAALEMTRRHAYEAFLEQIRYHQPIPVRRLRRIVSQTDQPGLRLDIIRESRTDDPVVQRLLVDSFARKSGDVGDLWPQKELIRVLSELPLHPDTRAALTLAIRGDDKLLELALNEGRLAQRLGLAVDPAPMTSVAALGEHFRSFPDDHVPLRTIAHQYRSLAVSDRMAGQPNPAPLPERFAPIVLASRGSPRATQDLAEALGPALFRRLRTIQPRDSADFEEVAALLELQRELGLHSPEQMSEAARTVLRIGTETPIHRLARSSSTRWSLYHAHDAAGRLVAESTSRFPEMQGLLQLIADRYPRLSENHGTLRTSIKSLKSRGLLPSGFELQDRGLCSRAARALARRLLMRGEDTFQ